MSLVNFHDYGRAGEAEGVRRLQDTKEWCQGGRYDSRYVKFQIFNQLSLSL